MCTYYEYKLIKCPSTPGYLICTLLVLPCLYSARFMTRACTNFRIAIIIQDLRTIRSYAHLTKPEMAIFGYHFFSTVLNALGHSDAFRRSAQVVGANNLSAWTPRDESSGPG